MKILLVTAGVLNLLFMAFHVAMYWGMAHVPGVSESIRIGMYMFNTVVVLATAFLGFAFLIRRHEVMTTGLGAAALVFGALIYLSRAFRNLIWPSDDWTTAAICAAVGLVHVALLFGVKLKPVASTSL